MRRFRFTIASLLIIVLLVAFGFAALRESNDLWESGVFTLTLGVLLISILLAIHRTESRRAFWIGFAVFGWSYLGLTLVPSIESRLMTTKALAYLDSKVPGRTQVSSLSGSPGIGSGAARQSGPEASRSPQMGIKLRPPSQGAVGLWDATTGRLIGGWAGTTENLCQDRALSVCPVGGVVRWASLSPSLASFQSDGGINARSMLKGPLHDRPIPPSRQDPQHLRSPLSERLEAGG